MTDTFKVCVCVCVLHSSTQPYKLISCHSFCVSKTSLELGQHEVPRAQPLTLTIYATAMRFWE